jgi:hypothetical protein
MATTFSKHAKGGVAAQTDPPADEATAAPAAQALTIFSPANAANALMAVTDGSGEGQKSPFPILQVTGGATGGLFAPVKSTGDQDLLDMLPQGGKPVKGIFLAYRSEILAWPAAFKEGQENHDSPAWSGVIPAAAVADAQLAYKACEKYQFTKKDDKGAFDYAVSEVGHIRPSFQMLVYLAEINDVVIVQVPAYFSSWVETQKSLRALLDPTTKQLGQFPCAIRVVTEDVQNKAKTQSWKVHHCDVQQAMDAVTKVAWEKYQPWLASIQADAAKMALFTGWLNGEDRPLTDVHRAALRKATTL